MKILKLTTTSGNEVRINFEHVESYGSIINEKQFGKRLVGKTFIIPAYNSASDSCSYIVEETPEEIDNMLSDYEVKEGE